MKLRCNGPVQSSVKASNQCSGNETCLRDTYFNTGSCAQAAHSMRVNALTCGQMFDTHAMSPLKLRSAILHSLLSPARKPWIMSLNFSIFFKRQRD